MFSARPIGRQRLPDRTGGGHQRKVGARARAGNTGLRTAAVDGQGRSGQKGTRSAMPSPEDLHARALDLLVAGDTAGGITDLKAYLLQEPEDSAAWLSLGAAYASIDHDVQAAEALRRAVDLDGEDVEARLAYARALVRVKKLD